MDPGSMSPRKLGDVRDDVALEAGVEQGTGIDGSKELKFTSILSSIFTEFIVRQAESR